MESAFRLLGPAMVFICFFSFLAVTAWSNARRREREAFYKSETLKKIVETQGAGAVSALEFLREQEKISARQRREGLKLAGLISSALGLGLVAFLSAQGGRNNEPVSLVGLIPFLIGLALLIYAYVLGPKE